MKTRIAILTALLGLFVTATAFASTPVPASKAVSNSVANYITNELEYPEFGITQKYEGDVVVSVTIQEDGTFLVDASNGFNEEMKKYVVKSIHGLQSDYHAQYAGQQVLLKIKFDLRLV